MRVRTVIEIRVVRVDGSESELRLVTDDGRQRAQRSMQSAAATIDHAARCLADHYDLVPCGDGIWRLPARCRSSADEIAPAA